MAQPTLPARSAVPEEQTWNSTALFASWEAWQASLAAAGEALPALAAFAGRLGESPETLAEYIALSDEMGKRLSHLWVYVSMSSAVDNTDDQARAAQGQLMGFMGRMAAATAFARPEMQALGERLLEWAERPPLDRYRHFFEHLVALVPHTRSAEVEQILGMLADPHGSIATIHDQLINTDLKFAPAVDSQGQPQPVAQATIPPTGIQSPDREYRRTAWQSFFDGHLSMQNTLAATYITDVKTSVFGARVRKYSSVLESMLKPTGLPVEVFHNLINTFKANLGTWHRYWEAKRKVLGLKEMRPYDIWAPLTLPGAAEPANPVIPYAQAIEYISAALAPLGEGYTGALRRGCLEERWVDYAMNAGKGQGAFSTPAYDSPPFIFISYDNTLISMSVLAHELGHSMHSYLAQAQPGVYRGYGMMSSTVAETASNFNQAMLRAYLMEAKKDDPAFQLAVLDEALYNFHRYFFQMPTLARFEYEVYSRAEQGKPLNATILKGIMQELYAEGYGSTMTDEPERTAITWATFPHMFMPYYTFQYAVGISAAHALADRVLHHNGAADYLAMLSAGASRYPLDLFKLGGVDLSTPEPIEKTFAVLDNLVSRLEAFGHE